MRCEELPPVVGGCTAARCIGSNCWYEGTLSDEQGGVREASLRKRRSVLPPRTWVATLRRWASGAGHRWATEHAFRDECEGAIFASYSSMRHP